MDWFYDYLRLCMWQRGHTTYCPSCGNPWIFRWQRYTCKRYKPTSVRDERVQHPLFLSSATQLKTSTSWLRNSTTSRYLIHLKSCRPRRGPVPALCIRRSSACEGQPKRRRLAATSSNCLHKSRRYGSTIEGDMCERFRPGGSIANTRIATGYVSSRTRLPASGTRSRTIFSGCVRYVLWSLS